MAEPELLVDHRERLVRHCALVLDNANVGKGEELDHPVVGPPHRAQLIGRPAALRGRDDLVLTDHLVRPVVRGEIGRQHLHGRRVLAVIVVVDIVTHARRPSRSCVK